MTYSVKQAAEATGKTKPTILRAIQKGKISAKKTNMANGRSIRQNFTGFMSLWLMEPVQAPIPAYRQHFAKLSYYAKCLPTKTGKLRA
jgi:excisionase family DNA binding protein